MMRSSLSQACVAAALLLFVSGAAAAPARTNLLANPGFEQPRAGHPWMPAAWDTSEAGVTSVFFGRDTFLVEHGGYAVSVASVSSLRPISHHWNQAVVVGREAWGKDAVLTVWTRSNGLQGRASALIQAYRDTVTKMAHLWDIPRNEALERLHMTRATEPLYELGWRREYFSEPETGWVKRTVRTFVPPSVNVIWVRLGIIGTGQVLFDDAALTLEPAQKQAPPPLRTNLLRDPGFEGNGNEWEYSLPPFDNLQVVRDSTVSYSGRASIRMEGGLSSPIQGRAGVGQAFQNRALSGMRVRLTGRVKTDSLRGLAYLQMYAHTLSGATMQPPLKQYSMNTDWELASSEMDVPPDTYEVWVWFVYNAPAPGRLYYDDCSFEVLGPAPPAAKPGARKPAKR